jgi:hypothetical protein
MPDSFAIQINCETTTFTSDLSVDNNLTAENHIGNEFDAVIGDNHIKSQKRER